MIGIAMTTYNGEKYLKEQIDSILNQTVSDFELIVCDDVSSDSTMDILNGYAAKDSRVHVFRNEENLGFLKNFEKAIRICLDRGAEYVALADQDDIWTENHLEVLADTMSSDLLPTRPPLGARAPPRGAGGARPPHRRSPGD